MELNQQLQNIGLTKTEAAIYTYLLQNGLATPPQIAKGTGIARTNAYNVLQSLKAQALIQEQKAGKRKAYIANDPESLFQRIEERRNNVEQVLPDLRALYAQHQNKPIIRFFDGYEEIKQIYHMVLSTEEVYGIGSTNELARQGQAFYSKWLKELKAHNIVFYDILSHPSGEKAAPEMKAALRGLYDYKLMPKKYEDFPTDMLIWGDNIALLSLEEPLFGTVITNKTLAQTFRIIFKALWEKS
ncbi:MAG: hypothetical protein COW24_02460 [Candidatus Kerfeldbacteria bacterium CG15_BIG_FIL_POST_REV_8_21_14_020_45_12]|uniref:Transcription regulator TrmB N-terminal domain-containing protein n=1 Tax=Candidatus Kerfeldbacteria bacterium CG15_BIG_FIL_POST_REV_8_21_14_020_45_12 TaxID=2014247 RepID=A0A2M7H460_9BACT|nr:MAG: hypothetical protein COW24_02460 [Candidatus Kerfeldbacteria bacterium CG15_BIG_FIL_POST_REV_8_21_14_020_45_12]PJA92858.1 MAG: hypothetical protein CO132_05665 [Candidatus Kerfeldbacteria bacterium CG_4_9_14_3_um_filter_45_8]